MTPVYQTIVDPGKGNCMQAAVASLLDLPLEEVPHFIEYGENWFITYYEFLQSKGYEHEGYFYNKYHTMLWHINHDCFNKAKFHRPTTLTINKLKKHGGVNGYFWAGVLSPNYFNWKEGINNTHAVIIDTNRNVVHDPNPAYKNLVQYPLAPLLRYNGICDVLLIKKIDETTGTE